MTIGRWTAAAAGAAVAVRLVRSRHRRSLHPAGRTFAGELDVVGHAGVGSRWLQSPARFPVTVRISKGVGTKGGRTDLRGVAVRVHLSGHDLDLLLSTAGTGRFTRHLPAPRRSFDAEYSTITAYRTGTGEKVHLLADPDPDGPALGRALADLAEGDRIRLRVRHLGGVRTVGRVTLGRPQPAGADAALAFDPVRHSSADLHPTGLVHGLRAYAYRLSQHWRGVTPAAPDPAAVARAVGHR